MGSELVVESSLEHDGDCCVRYSLSARNSEFAATTHAWGDVEEHLGLARALQGFPTTSDSVVQFSFGGTGIGSCALEFFCLDWSGHVGVWLAIESDSSAAAGQPHQVARLSIRTEPAAIDQFVAALASFAVGRQNAAVLSGLAAR
jgi:hypothetical protein